MRVFMLGWEFPPYISGGLGTACFGLTKALSRSGVLVTFVLPRAIEPPTHLMCDLSALASVPVAKWSTPAMHGVLLANTTSRTCWPVMIRRAKTSRFVPSVRSCSALTSRLPVPCKQPRWGGLGCGLADVTGCPWIACWIWSMACLFRRTGRLGKAVAGTRGT